MNVIQQPNREIVLLLGKNLYFKDWKYRLNKFCIVNEIPDECILIFNTMTRALVSMTQAEYEALFIHGTARYSFLLENYFIVKDDYDEMKALDEIRFKFANPIDDDYFDEVYQFLILPTTGCNARCFYCYERKMSKSPMSIETAEDVVQFMLKKAKDPDRHILLRWFGGEPLVNMKVIDYICTRMEENNRHFNSTMVSNGYLFDEKVVEKAVNLWHLNDVQITLDGTEEIYNKAKNYIYKNQDKVSPYQKVVKNIEYLLNKNIAVSVRMNADLYNAEDLKKLVHEIGTKFKGNKLLGMYAWPIFEDEDNVRDNDRRQDVYEKIWEIEDVMEEYGYERGGNLDMNIRSHHCMVDGKYNILISPKGELGLCEHYIDSDFWGSIYSDEVNWDVVKSWRMYEPKLEMCDTCPRYPSCLRPTKCLDLKICTPQFRDFQLRHDKQSMITMYRNWVNNMNNGCNDTCDCGNGSCELPNNGNVVDVQKLSFKEKTKLLFQKREKSPLPTDLAEGVVDLARMSFAERAKFIFKKG